MNRHNPAYKSPLRVLTQAPSFVTYVDALSNRQVGTVYKEKEKWYLTSVYLNNGRTFEVFAKYAGFLFLNSLHKNRH